MAVDNSLIIRQVQQMEEMIVAFCAYTNMPLLVCDPETFNDQIWIFDKEEQLQEFAKSYTEKKVALRGVKFLNKDFLRFFSSLYMIGVNELVFVHESGQVNIELDKLVRQPDYSKLPEMQRPITNPNLELTGMYFMQEALRPIPNEEKENLKDLEEELAHNMVSARYIIAIELNEGEESDVEKLKNKNYRVPILKNKENVVFQPLFTDPLEFQKFAKGKKEIRALAVPFAQLGHILASGANGFMLNPNGFHIVMPKELIAGLTRRFQTGTAAPAPAPLNAEQLAAKTMHEQEVQVKMNQEVEAELEDAGSVDFGDAQV